MTREELSKALKEALKDGDTSLVDKMQNLFSAADTELATEITKREDAEKALEPIKSQLEGKDKEIDSLKGDLEKAGVEASESSKNLKEENEAAKKRAEEAEAKAEKIQRERDEEKMEKFFVDGLKDSFGEGAAADKVGNLMRKEKITLSKDDQGNHIYKYGDKTGAEAVEAIKTDNPDSVSGKDGVGVKPPRTPNNDQPASTLKDRMSKAFS